LISALEETKRELDQQIKDLKEQAEKMASSSIHFRNVYRHCQYGG
jgi:hypothetical protein